MSLWNKLFGQGESKFAHFENKLSAHEQIAVNKLHTTHPNVRNIQAKHGIDLRNVRKHGTKIAAAGAVLGMFLAIPYLFGHPTNTSQPTPPPQEGQVAKSVPKPQPSPPRVESPPPISDAHQTETPNISPQQPGSSAGTPAQPPAMQPLSQPPGQEEPSESQGHKYGRSYMAPPKEHGYHDLGQHRGEVKNPQVPNVGPHPTELDIDKNQEGTV